MPDGYRTIQEAINAAKPGYTVKVRAGIYREHIIINKSISLIGEGPERTVIDGGGFANPIITVTSDDVTIKGFKIRNGGDFAIHLNEVSRCKISGNVIESNYHAIYLLDSSNNGISSNRVEGNDVGIDLWGSSRNEIFKNAIKRNRKYGIYLSSSSKNNKIFHNLLDDKRQVVVKNSHNIWDDGYPSGGNYWSNYIDEDKRKGQKQDHLGSDGIWDHPYKIDENNVDRYPLTKPYGINLSLTHLNVSGSLVKVSVSVVNERNIEVTFNLILEVDGQFRKREVTLGPGESKVVRFTFSENPGRYRVWVGGLERYFTVQNPEETKSSSQQRPVALSPTSTGHTPIKTTHTTTTKTLTSAELKTPSPPLTSTLNPPPIPAETHTPSSTPNTPFFATLNTYLLMLGVAALAVILIYLKRRGGGVDEEEEALRILLEG